MPPRLYVLCGLPFGGKSTLAARLADRLGLVHLEVDVVNAERGVGLDGEPIPREAWVAAYREAHRRLDGLLAEGASVVFDATDYRRTQRERLRRIAARHGAGTTLIYLDVPLAEVRRRLEENRRTRRRADVRDEDVAQVSAEMQPPGPDERPVRYDPALPFDEWIRLLMQATQEQPA